ncbi:MAG: sigma-54 dependent transcriptional regulator [Nitrosomonas sp.]|nr:sigma-54 dependent transcriptional regulator [Nitrosomonas sp.]MDP1951073.1 sigma-54 dependent transcriptional regulator [Nitrosomonas sp.]
MDDEEDIRWALSRLVQEQGWKPVTASNGYNALACIMKSQPDVVLLDLKLPDLSGNVLIQAIHACVEGIPIIVITGNCCTQEVVKLMKAGICDYLTKPFDNAHVILTIRHAVEELRLKQEVSCLHDKVRKSSSLLESMGNSKVIHLINRQISSVAQTDIAVLICGETGTGKELVARAIHDSSLRSSKPFIAVDCGAIQESLMESTFFGHEKGAYTGANMATTGVIERAAGGTLFFDEIENMTLAMQIKFLRVLETKIINRLGSARDINVDFRIVIATNEDLKDKVAQKLFRADLYYRIAEFEIKIPSLRERHEDIPFLINRMIMLANKELKKNIQDLSHEAWELIRQHDWPGNVRELHNIIRRGVLLCNDGGIISPEHLTLSAQPFFCRAPPTHTHPQPPPVIQQIEPSYDRCDSEPEDFVDDVTLKDEVQRVVAQTEKNLLIKALNHSHGNKANAARLLHIDYKTIHYKLKGYGIEWPMQRKTI